MPHDSDQPILVLSRKKPHLIFILVLCLLSGLGIFITGSDDPELPDWITRSWAGFLLVSSMVALGAHFQKWDRERGMYVERGALTIQSAAVLAYGATLPQYLGWNAEVFFSIAAMVTFAAANLWEVQLIGADLKLIATVRSMGARSADASDD